MKSDKDTVGFPYNLYIYKRNAYFIVDNKGQIQMFNQYKSGVTHNAALIAQLRAGTAKAYMAMQAFDCTDIYELLNIDKFIDTIENFIKT